MKRRVQNISLAVAVAAATLACSDAKPRKWICEVKPKWDRHGCVPKGHPAQDDYSYDELYEADTAWCFPGVTRPDPPAKRQRYMMCVATKAECDAWQEHRRSSEFHEPTLAPCTATRPDQFINLPEPGPGSP